MTEHRIRLAKAWSLRWIDLPPRPVDLPVIWTEADLRQPFDLVRSFQRPAIDPTSQRIELELIHVPGLRTIGFHGLTIEPEQLSDGEPTRIQLDAQIQPGRNSLRLAVDLTGVNLAHPWGSIALVIVGDRT